MSTRLSHSAPSHLLSTHSAIAEYSNCSCLSIHETKGKHGQSGINSDKIRMTKANCIRKITSTNGEEVSFILTKDKKLEVWVNSLSRLYQVPNENLPKEFVSLSDKETIDAYLLNASVTLTRDSSSKTCTGLKVSHKLRGGGNCTSKKKPNDHSKQRKSQKPENLKPKELHQERSETKKTKEIMHESYESERKEIPKLYTNIEKCESSSPSIIIESSSHDEPILETIQLPTSIPNHFIERKKDLNDFIQILNPANENNIICIYGNKGTGKATFVSKALELLNQRKKLGKWFPEGVIYHDFYNNPQIQDLFANISSKCDRKYSSNPVKNVKKIIEGNTNLLVLNGIDSTNSEIHSLGELLSTNGKTKVILISEKNLEDIASVSIHLQGLNAQKAQSLYKTIDQSNQDPNIIGRICELLEGNPLLIKLVSAYLARSYSIEIYEYWIRQAICDSPDNIIDLVISKTLENLSENSKNTLVVLGSMVYAPFRADQYGSSINLEALTELESYNFIQRHEEMYQISHSLIHSYVQSTFPIPNSLLNSILQYYEGLFAENPSHKSVPTLLKLQELAISNGQYEEASLVSELLLSLPDLSKEETISYLVKAEESASMIPDLLRKGEVLSNTAGKYARLGQLNRSISCYHMALEVSREVDNRKEEGNLMNALGILYKNTGDLQKAIEYYGQALVIAQESNDLQAEAQRLDNLGIAYHTMCQYSTALEFFDSALKIARNSGNRLEESTYLGNMGLALHGLKQFKQSINRYKEALNIAQEINDKASQAKHTGNLGIAYKDIGDIDKAIKHYQKALELSGEINDVKATGNHLGNLGSAYRETGELEEAVQFLSEAVDVARSLNDKRSEGSRLGNLALVYSDLGKDQKAVECLDECILILESFLPENHPYITCMKQNKQTIMDKIND